MRCHSTTIGAVAGSPVGGMARNGTPFEVVPVMGSEDGVSVS
jgi:hypothetical protein